MTTSPSASVWMPKVEFVLNVAKCGSGSAMTTSPSASVWMPKVKIVLNVSVVVVVVVAVVVVVVIVVKNMICYVVGKLKRGRSLIL